MTGTLTLPAGTAAAPSLQFTGSTNTGLSTPTANALSFDINGTEAININSSKNITVDNFTGSAGVVHNNALGQLTSSLIVNADITPATIANSSLAAISSTNVANDIVVRDGSGNFSAGTITASLSRRGYGPCVAGLTFNGWHSYGYINTSCWHRSSSIFTIYRWNKYWVLLCNGEYTII